MKVTATQQGFFGSHLQNPGMQFEIPDTPTRKVTKEDDALTRSIAVKNQVPCAFSSTWMHPGTAPVVEDAPVQSHLKPPETEESIDLNSDVI